jgi:ribosomal protein S5
VVKATMNGLQSIMKLGHVLEMRGKTFKEILG